MARRSAAGEAVERRRFTSDRSVGPRPVHKADKFESDVNCGQPAYSLPVS